MTNSNPPNKHRSKRLNFQGREVNMYGAQGDFWQDLYHRCLTVTWPLFFLSAALVFLVLNLGFATLYCLDLDGIANLNPKSFLGAFFFSVETSATVGFGDMHPQSIYTHLLVTIELFIGMALMATLTGLTFARFSKPRARMLFAQHALMTRFDGQPTFMIRVANARHNSIVAARATLSLLKRETTQEGLKYVRIYDLDLVRDEQPMFILTWSVMHRVTPSSPLYGLTADDFAKNDMRFLLRVVGYDESIAQDVQARHAYDHSDVRFGHEYVDVTRSDERGVLHIDFSRFHHTREQTREQAV